MHTHAHIDFQLEISPAKSSLRKAFHAYVSARGAGETRALAPGLPVLVELVTHPEPGVACAAAGALAALLALWPADTAALLLAADNVPLLGARGAAVVSTACFVHASV